MSPGTLFFCNSGRQFAHPHKADYLQKTKGNAKRQIYYLTDFRDTAQRNVKMLMTARYIALPVTMQV